MCEDDENVLNNLVDNLAFYQIIEDKLKKECNFQGPVTSLKELSHASVKKESRNLSSPYHIIPRLPSGATNYAEMTKIRKDLKKGISHERRIKFQADDSVLYLNRYCAKLPSDTL